MYENVSADDAARALDEINRRADQVIEKTLVPDWFWWVVAGLNVALTAALESETPLVIGIGTGLFVLGTVVVSGTLVTNALRHAQVRNNLVGANGVLAVLAFVALILAVTLPAAFLLDAADVPHAAVIVTAVSGVVMIIGGPVLMRYIRRTMRSHRAGTGA
ncbi:hypothetical protein [Nocardia sp. NRRL S-836]|uniref:hypothetical protein n=1 Tax=Nocardia sp. NRRL S-836 TaxID=1519492 RepID=UPI0006AE4A41|nr:hypothetical protein [Nocardia sp. NRRL S-836]KOV87205.1 hypothetical protein ADL03_07570 [Nocardia sp. NRRL S-836]